MYYHTSYRSPLGEMTLASEGGNLCGLWFEGQKYFGGSLPEPPEKKDELPVFSLARKWLDRYFDGERPQPSELPLAPMGSQFRQAVWNILCKIPSGSVTTYGEIAKQIAAENGLKTMSAQAVGGAVGHNPISVIIPCHRVVGSNGSLIGYAGGINRKVKLLELEGIDLSRFFVPEKGTAWQ